PQEEELVLMFLDLQSSTTIAEQLGHKKYSALIRDCFNDLIAVADTKANILQYVGDEVVFYWPLETGINHANCLKAYFAFCKRLADKQDYYQQEYGVQPTFKAGANCGFVTITEVGTIKKELAFHGDTINTAARIQGLCSELNQSLLISERLKDRLEDSQHYQFEDIGKHHVKGKEEHLRLFAVTMLN
ncbi:MAG: adenylate/guanylate cyclase domain-containing protein, partial [Calditrichaeota bacterium]|nr:adenylate/guanylate cyclase domain-containing protein [Calditrichota bacterium]